MREDSRRAVPSGPVSTQLSEGVAGQPATPRGVAIRLLIALSSLSTGEPLTSEECAAILESGKYDLRFVTRDSRFVICTRDGSPLAEFSDPPALWDLYAALIDAGRTRAAHHPAWLHDTAWQVESLAGPDWPELGTITRGADPAGSRLATIRCWRRFDQWCQQDAVLRLHAVTRVPGGLDRYYPAAALPRAGGLHPPHPGYPGGTFAIGLPSLLGRLEDGKLLLRKVIEHANPDRLSAGHQLVEYFVRPLFAVFRALLDAHSALLPARSPADLAFEFSPELRPTGRLVLTGTPHPPDAAHAPDVEQVTTLLWTAARDLAAAAQASGLPGLPANLDRMIDDVAAAELRFLPADAVRILAALPAEHPLRRHRHAVDPAQSALLTGLLHRLEERVRKRRADPTLPRPAVRLAVPDTVPGRVAFARDVADVGAHVLSGQADPGSGVEVFADLTGTANAVVVTVHLPATLTERVADLERLPHPTPLTRSTDGPALSHTHSVAELPLAALHPRLAARDHRMTVSLADSFAMVDRLRAQAVDSAARTVDVIRGQSAAVLDGETDPELCTVRLVHHALTRKQFHRGARSTYPLAAAARDLRGFVRRGEPIQVVLPGFPVKQADSRLKAFGHRPDLGELATLIRLGELARVVRAFHPPGLRVAVLSDGLHFRSRPPRLVAEYAAAMRGYLALTGTAGFVDLLDVDDAAELRLGKDIRSRRAALRDRYRRQYRSALPEPDFAVDPLWTLELIGRADPTRTLLAELGVAGGPGYTDMFRSVLHSVPVPPPAGHDQLTWSKAVYADPYGVADPTVAADVRESRKRLLHKVFGDTVDYMSGLLADRELGYERIYPEYVRMTLSTPSPGRCGFVPLGGAGVLPWHGTAALNRRGEVSVDFAVSLADQGFVPVYSPLLGDDQPWFTVPVTETAIPEPGAGGRVRAELLAAVRLRRR